VKKTTMCFALLVVMISVVPVYGTQQPLDALRSPVDEVISILKDPQYDDLSKKSLEREKLWEAIQRLFDFTEIAKRTLARNWRNFAPQERKEFSVVFGEFLGNTYLKKIQKGFQNETVVYGKQEMVSDTKALVKTNIIRENVEIPVNYSMKMRNGQWRVYDVKIEGVSLVKNYRTQFEKLLMTKKPAELIERIKKKVAKQRQGVEASGEDV
jgi:phospholipid transport system substrate-binding protein